MLSIFMNDYRMTPVAAGCVTTILCSMPTLSLADTVTFDDLVFGSTSYGYDANGDSRDDVVFSTSDPNGFNTAGPGPNQNFIQEPGLEGSSLQRTDLTASFVNGATGSLSFGFALNSATEDESYAANFSVYDDEGNELASAREVGTYTTTPSGFSSFPEGNVELSFSGAAAYAELEFSSEFSRFIIDDFSGNFGAAPAPSDEITVLSSPPYDGTIPTRGLPGIDATFGYNFSGTEITAEFIVHDNTTLEEAAATRGFESFNFMQIVTEFPGGILSGCLGTSVPFNDPPQGGCLNPRIEADNEPFYYDIGEAWEGTDYFIGDRAINGVDRAVNELVQVGISFNDQPVSPLASEENPMSFVLFPVGIFPDGTYETLVTEALYWQSTNNFFFGGEVSGGVPTLVRANGVDDGLEGTVLSGFFAPLSDLTDEQRLVLEEAGFVDTAVVPLPASWLLFGSTLIGLFGISRRKARSA